MKYLSKFANLLIVWLPVIITFSLADNNTIPFCNNTLDVLDSTLCEEVNDEFPYALKNFAVSFLFMLLPTFIMLNVPFVTQIPFSYQTIETLILISVLVYNATASGLFYGFSVHQAQYLEKSSNVWAIAFVLAKTLSKIPHSDFGILTVFWGFFIFYPALFDPYMIGLEMNTLQSIHNNVFVITMMEFAWGKWQERRHFPVPFMTAALLLFNLSSIFFHIDESDQIVCDEKNNFQWLPAGRSLAAVGMFLYFCGFRKQERDLGSNVQNRFEEVNQREDDDQLI